jgi:hypothetical protein
MKIASTYRKSDGTRDPVWINFYVALCAKPMLESSLHDGPGTEAKLLDRLDIAFDTRVAELESSVPSTIINDAHQLWRANFGEALPKCVDTGPSRKRKQQSEEELTGTGSTKQRQLTTTTPLQSATSLSPEQNCEGSNVNEHLEGLETLVMACRTFGSPRWDQKNKQDKSGSSAAVWEKLKKFNARRNEE